MRTGGEILWRSVGMSAGCFPSRFLESVLSGSGGGGGSRTRPLGERMRSLSHLYRGPGPRRNARGGGTGTTRKVGSKLPIRSSQAETGGKRRARHIRGLAWVRGTGSFEPTPTRNRWQGKSPKRSSFWKHDRRRVGLEEAVSKQEEAG